MFKDKLLLINKHHLFDDDLAEDTELLVQIDAWLYENQLTDDEAVSLVEALQKVEREPTSLIWAAAHALGSTPNWNNNEAIVFLPDWFEIDFLEEELYNSISYIKNNHAFNKNIDFKLDTETFIAQVNFSLVAEKEICFLLKVASRENISDESLFILYQQIEAMDKAVLLRKYRINGLPTAYEKALIRMTKLFGTVDLEGRSTWPSIQLILHDE
jgi:hypothetical protein